MGTVAALMGRFRTGDREAAGSLMELLYPQLKRLACTQMRSEGRTHTWQPTVLVNELYLELVKVRALRTAGADQEEREAFLSLSAHLMRRLLVQHARPLAKRVHKEQLEDDLPESGQQSLVEIEQLLRRLEEIDPKLRMVVELRVFEDLTAFESAQRMDCSERTVARCWTFARNWLAHEMATERLR